jgi:hypothetical protein
MRGDKNDNEGKPNKAVASNSSKELRMEVNFIQVCRNYFRANSWRTQKALEFMYNSATASYLHLDCAEIDLVASIRVMRNGEPFYHPLLVKAKYCMQLSEAKIEQTMKDMRNLFKEIRSGKSETGMEIQNKATCSDRFSECPPALCLLVLLGFEAQRDKPSQQKTQFESEDVGSFPEADTFRVVSVPKDDAFGISSAIASAFVDQEMSEIFASHGFLYGEDDESTSVSPVLRRRTKPGEGTRFVNKLIRELGI